MKTKTKTFVEQVDPEATVLAFKLKISEQAGVSPELQRLIYKGRVMKDDQSTLASYSESSPASRRQPCKSNDYRHTLFPFLEVSLAGPRAQSRLLSRPASRTRCS